MPNAKNKLAIAGWILLTGWALTIVACSNSSGSKNPLGPSASSDTVRVSPEASAVARGGTVTFSAKGGTGTYTWTLNNASLASINTSTGAFRAGNSNGTVTVTAQDGAGRTGTATVNIVGQTLIITPAAARVAKGGTQTFTSNGSGTVFWSISNTTLGTIGTTSGTFTANGGTGTGTVTVVDSVGNSGTTTVEVFTPQIIMSPNNLTLSSIPTQTVTFTASGNVGTVFYSISGQSNGYGGVSIDSSTGVLTISSMPTTAQGSQTLTITGHDGIAADGTATLTLIAP